MSVPTAARPTLEGLIARLRSWRPDAVSLLTIFLALVFLVSGRLIYRPIGGAGRPAILFGLGLALVWAIASSLYKEKAAERRTRPIRWALLIWMVVFVASYAAGYARHPSNTEALASDRALIEMVALVGVAFLAYDGINDRRRIDVLLRRLTMFCAFGAVIAVIQFVLKVDLSNNLVIPGFSFNTEPAEIATRGSAAFARVRGTAIHPIEFSVVVSMVLPIAVHYALHSRTKLERQLSWGVVGILGVAVPIALSRSGVLGLAVGMAYLLLAWNWRQRVNALVIAAGAVVAFRFVTPGLIGTLKSLFLNIGTDPSIRGRTTDYGEAFGFVSQFPLLGRGPRTFVPSIYFPLDNQYLNTLITMGYLGLSALIMLFVTGFYETVRIFSGPHDPATRHLGRVLGASMLVAVVSSATFDSLAFPSFAGVFFLLLGVIGALRRLADAGEEPDVLNATPPVLERDKDEFSGTSASREGVSLSTQERE